jgi:hypothetical protein
MVITPPPPVLHPGATTNARHVTVREATLADVPFIDQLQKLHHKQLGFMRTSWIEGKIKAGQILIAEETRGQGDGETRGRAEGDVSPCPLVSLSPCPTPLGYCISTDRYQKHDDIGIVYQMNVSPGRQRAFVGATLLKAVFDRAAYGCKLFCCWCAQDLAANRFWEAMGFVPLAYRAGSEKKRRVHIFWQKRIREGDTETAWWFPAATNAGAMNADRIVLPIPPGLRWSDEMPVIVRPEEPAAAHELSVVKDKRRGTKDKRERNRRLPATGPARKPRDNSIASGGIRFGPAAPVTPPESAKVEKKVRAKKPKAKNDPKLAAAARELRDRYLEHVNAGGMMLEAAGKYDVTRALPGASNAVLPVAPARLLPAA